MLLFLNQQAGSIYLIHNRSFPVVCVTRGSLDLKACRASCVS